MAPRGRAWAAVAAALLTITMVVPSLAARAELLGGLADVTDGPVDTSAQTLDETTALDTDVDPVVAATEEVADATVGDSGIVDATTDAVGDTLATGTETIRDTVDGGSLLGDEPDDPPSDTDVPATNTRTTDSPTTKSNDSPALSDDASGLRTDDEAAVGVTDRNPSPDDERFGDDGLDVLVVAAGLADPSLFEPVRIVAPRDDSLYGRLLDWLAGAGSGVLGLLAGPLLALEILLRALLSAGSGLVAPASLLVSYLLRLLWESRARNARPSTTV